ncbi:MAG TPA: AAA family ATPase [Ramlibacter sp.]|nr:AAA family ATPase [Ramlibacter sp.]
MRASTRVFADDARELFIGGIGGIGKSTLLAKFILQHVGRVPGLHFVYLDFDRSSISPVQPLTMLLEMMRQLGWQFPAARGALEALRTDARAEARTDAGNPGSAPAQPSFAGPGNPALPAELLGPTALLGYLTRLNRILEDASPARERPFLLVLDTFEEVQALGDEGVARVQAFLDIAKDTLSPLRIVLVGRDTADGFFPDARRLVLQEYDQASRRVFLEARGVPSRISAKVARTVGGRPLALQLAARLVRDMGEEAVSLSVGERLKGFFSSALIEGVLYRRILDHIHDPDVRRIAHPGLVLRRLNAEVIEMVLIPALELKDFDKRKIAQVMAALRNQKDLVRVEADGSVTHRPDVREQMLALMVAEDAARVRALHHAAARYYRWKQEQPGDADGRENARVEEIYHLLGAGESLGRIPALWIAKARVALGFAVQELFLPGARGTLKVMLGRTPTEEEEAGLPPELLSQHVLGVAAASLAGNQPERGLQYLNRYAGHVPADTRKELFARLLDRAGYWKDALPFYRELLDAAGRIPHALMLDVADFFERQRAVMEERSELLACLRERERELTASSGGDMLRVSLALWRLQLRLEQPPDGLPPYLDEVLSGDAQLRRSRLRDDDLRWLVTLTPAPHPRLLRLAVPSRMTDSMAGQLRFLAALASGALQLPEELRTACALAETLEESGSLKADFAFLPPQRTMEDAYWMLLRHVLRPATPQWYVPFASVLLDERGTVTPEALCGDMLPLLPFHAPKRLQSTKSLADFLGQLDELGILQIVLQGRTGRALSADSRRGEPLLLAYLAWRETYFRDMDGRMRYLLQAYMRGRGASK